MKAVFLSLIIFTVFGAAAVDARAQYRKLTVILLRHAEKDVSETADTANPELSPAGRLRAEKLVSAVNKYRPDAIYSTAFIRTRATAAPISRRRRRMIQLYDYRQLDKLAALINTGNVKRILVVGHNSTTPALANLLIGQDKYKQLAENEYDKIWVIKIKRNKRKPNAVKDEVITY